MPNPRRRTTSRSHNRRLGYESLEGRKLLSVTPGAIISGEIYNDVSGKGSPSDGPGLSGVTVKLYQDGGDGKFEGSAAGSDDTLVGTATTNSAGDYSFSNLSAGTYFVQEVVPNGYVVPSSASSVQTVVISTAAANGTPGVVVDSFQTSQLVDASSLTTETAASSVAAPEAVGGNRDESVQLTSTFGDVNLNSNAYDQQLLEFNSTRPRSALPRSRGTAETAAAPARSIRPA